MVINKKINFFAKKLFFPDKRKNLNSFRTDVPISFHNFCTLEEKLNLNEYRKYESS